MVETAGNYLMFLKIYEIVIDGGKYLTLNEPISICKFVEKTESPKSQEIKFLSQH